jgi:hypothetical protein
MSIKFSHENSDRVIDVSDSYSKKDSSGISFKKNNDGFKKEESFDFFKEQKDEENLGLDFIANESKRISSEKSFSDAEDNESQSELNIGSDSGSEESGFMKEDYGGETQNSGEPELSYDEIQQQKAHFLSHLKRLEAKGHVPSRRLGMEHSLHDIKGEVFKIRKDIEIDRGINYCRQGLMFACSTIEMANKKYDLGGELDGWSTSMMVDKENYDDVFEELIEKYSSKVAMLPEIKLIAMFAGSAMMFHLQKSMMKKYTGGGEATSSKFQEVPERKMRGPSVNSEELLRKLNSDDFSDISSVVSDIDEPSSKTISMPQPKKRGRKPKNSK